MIPISEETKKHACQAILEFVKGSYDNWHITRDAGGHGKEPAITLGLVANYLAQHSIAHDAPYLTGNAHFTRWTYRLASVALGRLKRSKHLITSWGSGLRGKEVRCYEPGPRAWEG